MTVDFATVERILGKSFLSACINVYFLIFTITVKTVNSLHGKVCKKLSIVQFALYNSKCFENKTLQIILIGSPHNSSHTQA